MRLKKLSDFYLHLDRKDNNVKLEDYLRAHVERAFGGELTSMDAFFVVLSAFDDCIREILSTTLTSEKKDEYTSHIEREKAKFCQFVMRGGSDNPGGQLLAAHQAAYFSLFSDVVSASGGRAIHELDRSEMSSALVEVVEHLDKSEFDGFTKGMLQIELTAIQKMINHAAIFPDTEIRLRLKAIAAECERDVEKFDDQFKSFSEKIVSFAKKYTSGGLVTLAIAADVSSVAGLLMPPGD